MVMPFLGHYCATYLQLLAAIRSMEQLYVSNARVHQRVPCPVSAPLPARRVDPPPRALLCWKENGASVVRLRRRRRLDRMRHTRHHRTALTDAILRELCVAGGRLGSVRLRMTVEAALTPVPDATWYAALNRLADDGFISDPPGRHATADDVQACLDQLTDLSVPLSPARQCLIRLTRPERSFARVLLTTLATRTVPSRTGASSASRRPTRH